MKRYVTIPARVYVPGPATARTASPSPAVLRSLSRHAMGSLDRGRLHFSKALTGTEFVSGSDPRAYLGTLIHPSPGSHILRVVIGYVPTEGGERCSITAPNNGDSEDTFQPRTQYIQGDHGIDALNSRYQVMVMEYAIGNTGTPYAEFAWNLTIEQEDQWPAVRSVTVSDHAYSIVDSESDNWVELADFQRGRAVKSASMIALADAQDSAFELRRTDPLVHWQSAATPGAPCQVGEPRWRNALFGAGTEWDIEDPAGFRFQAPLSYSGESVVLLRVRIRAWSSQGVGELMVATGEGSHHVSAPRPVPVDPAWLTFSVFCDASTGPLSGDRTTLQIFARDSTMSSELIALEAIICDADSSGGAVDTPTFELGGFGPAGTLNPPGLDRLPDAYTVNGVRHGCLFRYDGAKAPAGGTWVATYGADLPISTGGTTNPGAGVNWGPGIGALDGTVSVTDRSYVAAAAAAGDITTEDFILRLEAEISATNGAVLCQKHDGTHGWIVTANSSAQLVATLNGAGGNATVTSGTLSAFAWHFAELVVDKSGSAQWHVNWAASGSAAAVSSVGSLTNTGYLRIGSNGTTAWGTARIGHVSMLAREGWLDTHDQLTTHKEAFQRLTGWYPQRTAGASGLASTLSRASNATMEISNGSVTRVVTVGSNWPRINVGANGCGLVTEGAAKNWLALSRMEYQTGANISRSHTAPDPSGGSAATRVEQTAVGFGSFAYTNCIVGHSTDGLAVAFWLDKVSLAGVVRFENSAYHGALLIDFATFPAGWTHVWRGYTGPGVTFTQDWYPLAATKVAYFTGFWLSGGSGSVVYNIYGISIEQPGHQYSSSTIRTAGATATRLADSVTFSGTGILGTAEGTVALEALSVSGNTATVCPISIVGAAGESVAITSESETGHLRVVDGSTEVADVAGSTDINTGAFVKLQANYSADSARLTTAGAFDGTEDDDCAMPTLTDINIGTGPAAANPFQGAAGGIRNIRIYKKNLKRVI